MTEPTCTLPIIFEHEDFAVVNKPVGVPMHDAEHGIITRMRADFPQQNWFLVHRLDTATSGCILLAKNAAAASALSQMFADRSIEKYYLALSDKKPHKKQGMIKGDMKKARKGSMMLTKSLSNPAITQYFSFSARANRRLFLCKLHTGKTHQIRVALKSQGAAILGDTRYQGTPCSRMHLYSFAMRFEYQGEFHQISHYDIHHSVIDKESIKPDWFSPWLLAWPSIT